MSDIAEKLGISKKTLYQEIDSKESLITTVILDFLSDEKKYIDAVIKHSDNAIDEISKMSKYIIEYLKKVQPSLMHELQKYYPESYRFVDKDHIKFVHQTILNNLKRGIEEGIYRSNMNLDIVTQFYINNVRWSAQQTEFPLVEIFKTNINYHLLGVVNDKGLAIYKKLIIELENA